MFARCPHCQTVYRVHAEQLLAADGRVRCSACRAGFNALGHLYDTAAEAFADVTEPEAGSAEPAAAEPGEEDAGEASPPPVDAGGDAVASATLERAVDREEAAEAWGETDSSVGKEEAPSGTGDKPDAIPLALMEDFEPETPNDRLRRWLQSLAMLLLVLALFGQWIYSQRASLYALPEWQPWLERFCGVLQCELPRKQATHLFDIQHRDVRSHPQVDGALLVNATVVNQAAFPQDYPFLGLFFSDLTGQQQAGRWFSPDEYLESPGDRQDGIAPGESIRLRLEIVDPGVKLISYQFDFR